MAADELRREINPSLYPAPEFRRRIRGTFQVPLYLTGNGAPGQRFALDATGLPQRQANPFVATFTCNLPQYAPAIPPVASITLTPTRTSVPNSTDWSASIA